jgi:hypothetical protein
LDEFVEISRASPVIVILFGFKLISVFFKLNDAASITMDKCATFCARGDVIVVLNGFPINGGAFINLYVIAGDSQGTQGILSSVVGRFGGGYATCQQPH